jgi:hypothetical protein
VLRPPPPCPPYPTRHAPQGAFVAAARRSDGRLTGAHVPTPRLVKMVFEAVRRIEKTLFISSSGSFHPPISGSSSSLYIESPWRNESAPGRPVLLSDGTGCCRVCTAGRVRYLSLYQDRSRWTGLLFFVGVYSLIMETALTYNEIGVCSQGKRKVAQKGNGQVSGRGAIPVFDSENAVAGDGQVPHSSRFLDFAFALGLQPGFRVPWKEEVR